MILNSIGNYRLYKIFEIYAEKPEIDSTNKGRYARNKVLIFLPNSSKCDIGDEWKACCNYELAKKIIDLNILKNNFYNSPFELFLNESYLYKLTLEEKSALKEMNIDIEFKNKNVNDLSNFHNVDKLNKNKINDIINFYNIKKFKELRNLNIKKLEELSKNLRLRKVNFDKFIMYKKQQELNRII